MNELKELIVYTDGAAIGNPGKGGYGIVMMWGKARKELAKAYKLTTNNRMELMAVIVALESLTRNGIKVHIYTDSQYVYNAITKGWVWSWQKKGWKDKKNIDLWKRFLLIADKHELVMHWVKGHAGNKENERCDELATGIARKGPWSTDHGYESENVNQLL